MAKGTSLPGYCFSCQQTFDKRGIGRHLKTCTSRKDAIDKEKGEKTRIFHLRIEDPYDSSYWLDIEMAATSSLSVLDQFLRDIWLECCGHLSHFIVGETYYSYYIDDDPFFGSWKREEYDLSVPLEKAFPFDKKIVYEYDFGSTTELSIKIIAAREGVLPRGKTARLLSRNFSPVYPCAICGKPAKWVDVSKYQNNLFCNKHTDETENDGMLLPLVNSPRTGVCGYEGTETKEYEFERFS